MAARDDHHHRIEDLPSSDQANTPPHVDMVDDLESWLNQSYSREATGAYDDVKLEPLDLTLSYLPKPPPPITFAGTKGKGSSLAFTEAVLLANGCSTVAFTSPHVRSICERWRIDGADVSTDSARAAAQRVASAEQRSRQQLTYFERCFAIACVLAAEHPQAVFLCEVGLGGRLDCANAVDCHIAVLTHLSRDHCAVLGHQLTAIAGEKLAISRPNKPLLIAPQSDAARSAIEQRLTDPHLSQRQVEWLAPLPQHTALGLAGAHQLGNAAVAVRIAELLGLPHTAKPTAQALANTTLPARCQLITKAQRRILVDGAHNGPSIAATLATAEQLLRSNWQLIIGCASDKQLDEIEAAIADHAQQRTPTAGQLQIFRCGYAGPRSRNEQAWTEPSQAWPWQPNISAALKAVPPEHDLCITGSFYLASEALAVLNQ